MGLRADWTHLERRVKHKEGKRMERTKQNIRDMGENVRRSNICVTRDLEVERR